VSKELSGLMTEGKRRLEAWKRLPNERHVGFFGLTKISSSSAARLTRRTKGKKVFDFD
jgi:hypothetical protein